MDFRSAQPQPNHSATPVTPTGSPVNKVDKVKRGRGDNGKWIRGGLVAILFCITIIIVALIGIVAVGGNDQSKFVKDSDYQAVFLTNGQVYFGNIQSFGKDYIDLTNIYYLTQNTTTSTSGATSTDGNYTLVKLGCQQIHDPLDQMVISRDQVSFWENLNGGGKVVTSIKAFQKQNPNGPDCSQVSSQTQASSNSSTQGSATNTTTGTGSTATNTTTNTTSNTTKP